MATADELTVDFCVGVTAPFAPVGAVVPLETPHGLAAILAWCREHDRRLAGPSWEVYGHWNADPAQLRTEVYWLLQAAGALGTS